MENMMFYDLLLPGRDDSFYPYLICLTYQVSFFIFRAKQKHVYSVFHFYLYTERNPY